MSNTDSQATDASDAPRADIRCGSWAHFLQTVSFDRKRRVVFVVTDRVAKVGSSMQFLITLPTANRKIQIAGTVISVLPAVDAARLNRSPGVSLHLTDNTPAYRDQLQQLLSFAKRAVDATRPGLTGPLTDTPSESIHSDDWFDDDVHQGSTGTMPVTVELAIAAVERCLSDGRLDEASRELQQAAAIDQQDPRVICLRHLISARRALAIGDKVEASHCYTTMLEIDGSNVEAKQQIAKLKGVKAPKSGFFARILARRK